MNFNTDSYQEVAEYIRWWLGELPITTLSEDTLLYIIEIEALNNSISGCELIYRSTVAVLEYLVRVQAKGQASSGGGGSGSAVKSIEEKVGGVTKKTTWDTSSSSSDAVVAGWDRVLEDLKDNPDSIGCDVFPDITGSSKSSSVIFGGVSQSEYDKVRNNSDSRNGWNPSSPFRDNLYKRNY